MKNYILLFCCIFSLTLVNAQGLGGLVNKAKTAIGGKSALSADEAGSGLKEALNLGVDQAVSFLSAKDGYFASPYKILLPEEAKTMASKLRMVPGFEKFEQDLLEKMNRSAEDAAALAKPIFVDAIKKMTFQDAMNILMGEKDAATRYLDRNTSPALNAAFLPVVQASLDKFKVREYWSNAVTAYNKIPLVKKMNPELDKYVTEKALVGMFKLVEVKEADIRTNVNSRSSDLLKKVFGQQDKKP
jgi:hypothetical protein